METKQLGRYQAWLAQAAFDLEIAKISRQSGFNEWSCFQAEQSLEKCLKAILVHAGWRAPKIHKLGVLMGMCNAAYHDFAQVKIDYHFLESFTFIARYPFLLPGQNLSPHEFITRSEADRCIDQAENAYRSITSFLKVSGRIKGEQLRMNRFTEAEIKSRIDGVISKLQEKFAPEKVYVFGSFAHSFEQPKDKTLDLLMIADTDIAFFDRIQKVREITRGAEPIIEPLIYTPAEFKQMLEDEGEGFLESAIEEAKIVFEKSQN